MALTQQKPNRPNPIAKNPNPSNLSATNTRTHTYIYINKNLSPLSLSLSRSASKRSNETLTQFSLSLSRKNGRNNDSPGHHAGPHRHGDGDRDADRQLRDDRVGVEGQVSDRVEADEGLRQGVRSPPAPADRALSLRGGRGPLLGRAVRALRVLGRRAPPLGPRHQHHGPPVRGAHEGRALRGVLDGQQADRVGLPRPHHKAVEHPRGVQVHDSRGRRALGLGELREVLPQQPPADHRVGVVGPHGEGVEPLELQAPQHPGRPRRLRQHRRGVPRRVPLRQRRQGQDHPPVGPGRGQAPLLPRRRLHHPRPLLQPQQVLALRRHREQHQDLGPREQDHRRGPQGRPQGRGREDRRHPRRHRQQEEGYLLY